MTVDRETYTELTHAMMYAVARSELQIGQVASVLYACAQPDTIEETIDLTRTVRDRLTDWPQESKGRLIAIECVRLTFKCQNMHGPCDRGVHQVMMTRIIGNSSWEPKGVVSQHNFDEVVLAVTQEQHNTGSADDKFVVSRAKGSTLMSAFAEMFGNETDDQAVEREMAEFRAELDALFPSNPQPGKEEGHESS